ncbi:MAG: VWA domain-containing protein [Candidatus Woesearchaeota archaeon]
MSVRVVALLSLLVFVAAVCSVPEAQQFLSSGTDYVFDERAAIDYALVIDRSGSMRVGNRFQEVQAASSGFVNQLILDDRAAIIAFDSGSIVYSSFSSDKQHLQETIARMRIGDWTQYQAGLYRALEEYQAREVRNEEIMIFMSDGRPDDRPEVLEAAVDAVLEAGICIFTIAYSDEADEQAQEVLRDVASRSQNVTGCGSYFRAEEDSYDLQRIYSEIFDLTSSVEVFDVDVDVSVDLGVRLDVSARSSINSANIFSSQTCFSADIDAVISREGIVMFSQRSKESFVEVNLPRGEYEYFVSVRETCDGACSFSGLAQGSFVIEEGEVACDASFHEYSGIIRGQAASQVAITSSGFSPQEVSTDGLVMWINEDSLEHQLLLPGAIESVPLRPGDAWQYAFTPGVHEYSTLDGGYEGIVRARARSDARQQGVDIVLVVDVSGSMAGLPLTLAKNSSLDLVSRLGPRDRMSVVSFSSRASVVVPLTSNRQSLERGISSLLAGGSTNYVLGLTRSSEVLSTSRGGNSRVVIFLSDGIPTDEGGVVAVKEAFSSLLGDECFYTIGYAHEGVLAAGILNELAQISAQRNGCGLFYYAPSQSSALSQILGEIFSLSTGEDLELYDVSVSRVSGQSFAVSTRVRSAHNAMEVPSFGVACIPSASVAAFFGDRRYPLQYYDGVYSARIFIEEGVESGFLVASLTDEGVSSRSLAGLYAVSLSSSSWFVWVLVALFMGFVGLFFAFRTGHIRA